MNEHHHHIVRSYDQEQAALLEDLIRMGQMAASQLEAALDVVERRDDSAARRIVANDESIDESERRISHAYVMDVQNHPTPLIITDAAINIAPTLEEKADIIRNAIDLAHVIGIEKPKVAILSAVETVNPAMQSTLDAAALCKMADRGQITGGILDGPLAFDNAISE